MDVKRLLRQLANDRLTPDEIRQLQALSETAMFPDYAPQQFVAGDKNATRKAYEQVARKLGHRRVFTLYRPLAAAAVLTGMLLLAAYFFFKVDVPLTPLAHHVQTGAGQHLQFRLPDGSHVAMNGNSRLQYNGRQVTLLQGEIFLDVTPDPAHPFTVQSGHTQVQVLGTSFAVRYREEKVRVAVKTGRVAVNGKTLDAGHQIADGEMQSAVSPQQVGNWINNELTFEDATLEEILKEINHTYGFRYSTTRKDLLQKRYRVAFRQRNVNDMLYALGTLGNFTYQVKDSLITIP